MENFQIEVDGISIEICRKPIKNMHLRIYPPDGLVRVSAPLKLSLNLIYKQIEAKQEWLHAQRARLQALPRITELLFHPGEQHYFLGNAYTLTLIEDQTIGKVTLEDNLLCLNTPPNSTLHQKELALKKWYQHQMHLIVHDLIKKWQPIINVEVATWGTKTMKTRWGSCNTRTHRIWLNLLLIKKPLACLEYVLVHEMVHLLEASHNKRFHQFMDQFMPNWRIHKKTLNLLKN